MSARELADLAITSTQYLQALTTATLGGVALILGQRFLGKARLLDDKWRRAILAFGLLALSLSLLTGFVTIEALIEAANQKLVHEKLEALRYLRIVQSGFLLCGVTTTGGILVWDIAAGTGEVKG